jgi:hypothetical protein
MSYLVTQTEMDRFMSASNDEKNELFYAILSKELPLGVAWIEEVIEQFKNGDRDDAKQGRLSVTTDPHGDVGKQAIRCFFDVPRQVIEQKHGVKIGTYNCCTVVVSDDVDALSLSMEEQLALQTTPNC